MRLKRAGFAVKIEEVLGSVMKLYALKEYKQSYKRAANASKKKCDPWDRTMEQKALKIIAPLIVDSDKYILGVSLAYQPFLDRAKAAPFHRIARDACHCWGPMMGNLSVATTLSANHEITPLVVRWDMRAESNATWDATMDFLQEQAPSLFAPGHERAHVFPAEMIEQFGARLFQKSWPSDGEKGISNSIENRTVLIGRDGTAFEGDAGAPSLTPSSSSASSSAAAASSSAATSSSATSSSRFSSPWAFCLSSASASPW